MASKAERTGRGNALRHGLTAKSVGQSGEVLAFTPIYEDCRAEYRPRKRQEDALVETLAEIRWRLNQVLSVETSLIFPDSASTPAGALQAARRTLNCSRPLVNISLYEQRLHRHFRQVELELRELQLRRKQKDRERHRKIAEAPYENKAVLPKFEKTNLPGRTHRFFDGSFTIHAESNTARCKADETANVPKVAVSCPDRQSRRAQNIPLRTRAGAFG